MFNPLFRFQTSRGQVLLVKDLLHWAASRHICEKKKLIRPPANLYCSQPMCNPEAAHWAASQPVCNLEAAHLEAAQWAAHEVPKPKVFTFLVNFEIFNLQKVKFLK